MNVEIIEKEKKLLAGFSVFSDNLNDEFTEIIEVFNNNKDLIENSVNSEILYGIESYTKETDEIEKWHYFIGLEIDQIENINPIFNIKKIPKSLYAKMIYKGSLSNIDDAYNFLYENWLPNSEYKLKHPIDIEIFDLNTYFDYENKSNTIEILIPIKKK